MVAVDQTRWPRIAEVEKGDFASSDKRDDRATRAGPGAQPEGQRGPTDRGRGRTGGGARRRDAIRQRASTVGEKAPRRYRTVLSRRGNIQLCIRKYLIH
jgi:hypothetical protein